MHDVDDDWIAPGPRLRQGLSRRPTPTSPGCSTATASSSTAPRASACCRRRRRSTCSCTGPIARASGVVRDLRKDEPYLAYKDFDFKVICATAGDCYARYLVRMEEMRESLKIIQQADREPARPARSTSTSTARSSMPDKLATYRSIEGLIQHFELIMTNRQWTPPVDEVYGAIEVAQRRAGLLHRVRRHRPAPTGPARGRRRSSTSPCSRT